MEALSDRWRRPKFRPQCTHPTMSRLYGSEFLCDHCHRPGHFGWIYRCSHDREEVIDFALSQGYPVRSFALRYRRSMYVVDEMLEHF